MRLPSASVAPGESQPLLCAAFLPERARPSRPLASSDMRRAAPRHTVAESQPVTAALFRSGTLAGSEAAMGANSMPRGQFMSAAAQTNRIRELNDTFRTTLVGGQCIFTSGVSGLGVAFSTAALAAVRAFDDFTSDNDPYGEHDFGVFTLGDDRLLWKIDYYDLSLHFGSKNPSDPSQTKRVLTIMLADEY